MLTVKPLCTFINSFPHARIIFQGEKGSDLSPQAIGVLWYISNFEIFEKNRTLIEITPVEKVSGCIKVPGSKSYTNRALLIAALADGVSRLEKPLVSDDTKFMLQACLLYTSDAADE